MENLPLSKAEINFVVECHCPNCGGWNKYQQLSAIHTNTKHFFNNPEKKDYTFSVKCNRCDKSFNLKGFRFV